MSNKLIPKCQTAWTPIYRTNVNPSEENKNQEILQALARATEGYRNGEIDEKQQQKDKRRQAFTNAMLAGAMAEDPEMMIASGWRQNEDGNFVQDQINDPGVNALRNNLAVLGATTLAAPIAGYMTSEAAAMGWPWWRNFIGEAATGMAGGITTDAVYKGLTGKSWAQGVRDILPEGPKWISDENKDILADMTNPGYYIGGAWASQFVPKTIKSPKLQPIKTNQTQLPQTQVVEQVVTKPITTPSYIIEDLPGYQLKMFMKGSPLEKALSKSGQINVNSIKALLNKMSKAEQEIVNTVLENNFKGQNTIDYNDLRRAVQNEIITYKRVPQTKWQSYGLDGLGFFSESAEGRATSSNPYVGVTTNTFTFESPRLPYGSNKHYDLTTLGHSRTFTTQNEPDILHILESQSDWAQEYMKKVKHSKTSDSKRLSLYQNSLIRAKEDLKWWENLLKSNLHEEGRPLYEWERKQIEQEFLPQAKRNVALAEQRLFPYSQQHFYLSDNYLDRQLQENMKYASEKGLKKMRYPTSETAAKIEGFQRTELNPKLAELQAELDRLLATSDNNLPDEIVFDQPINYSESQRSEMINQIKNQIAEIQANAQDLFYTKEHQTILDKYKQFPKQFKKLFNTDVRIVMDTNGNTWYEVDVPENYLSQEWKFKTGGRLIPKNRKL